MGGAKRDGSSLNGLDLDRLYLDLKQARLRTPMSVELKITTVLQNLGYVGVALEECPIPRFCRCFYDDVLYQHRI